MSWIRVISRVELTVEVSNFEEAEQLVADRISPDKILKKNGEILSVFPYRYEVIGEDDDE